MPDENARYADIEETFFNLIRAGAGDMDHGNLLVMLSLVNLMGIINIINFRAGLKKNEGPPGASRIGGQEGAAESPAPGKGLPFDPASLLAMLGGNKGAGPGQLEGLLKHFMGPPPSAGQAGKEAAGSKNKDLSAEAEKAEKTDK